MSPETDAAWTPELADSFAQSLAEALREPVRRQAILQALKRSRLPKHRVSLLEYLASPAGELLAEQLARRVKMSVEALLAADGILTRIALWLPRVTDRTNWIGQSDVVVVGSARSAPALLMMTRQTRGFGVGGYPTQVDLRGGQSAPYILVAPVLGNKRLAVADVYEPSPASIVSAVSTAETELAALATCDPFSEPTCCEYSDECEGPPSGGGTPGVFLGVTFSGCVPGGTPSGDDDRDGILDSCEETLALTFQPLLRFHALEGASGREPYFAARRSPTNGRIRLLYALGYYQDAGFPGSTDWDHYGDSEFCIVEVGVVPGTTDKWQVFQATLSAHWNSVNDQTATYEWFSLEYASYAYPDWGVKPIVYVSWGKHANYRSDAVCDAGAFYLDDCSAATSVVQTGLPASSNLGNKSPTGTIQLRNCVSSRSVHPGTECFWSNVHFRGWWGAGGSAAGGYQAILSHFGF